MMTVVYVVLVTLVVAFLFFDLLRGLKKIQARADRELARLKTAEKDMRNRLARMKKVYGIERKERLGSIRKSESLK